MPHERLAQDLQWPELDAEVGGGRPRLDERVAARQPAEVAPDSEFARVVGRAPAEPQASLEVRPAAALGGVGMGHDGVALGPALARGERRRLNREPQRVAHLCRDADLR